MVLYFMYPTSMFTIIQANTKKLLICKIFDQYADLILLTMVTIEFLAIFLNEEILAGNVNKDNYCKGD